jgi:hypothetical protein
LDNYAPHTRHSVQAGAQRRRDTESSFGSVRPTAKAGFQLAATLRYALAGMTTLCSVNAASACVVLGPFKGETELTLNSVGYADIAFEGVPIAIKKISGKSNQWSKGAVETTFKINFCVKGPCGRSVKVISEDFSGLSDCDFDNTALFKSSLKAKKPLWVAASFEPISSSISTTFHPGHRVLYYKEFGGFTFEAHPTSIFKPLQ